MLSNTTSNDRVEMLLSDIASFAFAILNEYKSSGQDLPSSSTTTPHPLDSVFDNIALKKALYGLDYACNQLRRTLTTPAHAIGESLMVGSTEPACIRVAAEARIADILLYAPDGLPIEEISKQVPYVDAGKLERTIRYLVSRGYFQESSPRVFANNRWSLGLLSTNSISAAAGMFSDDIFKGNALLWENFTDPDSAFSYAPNKSPLVCALNGLNGTESDLFTLYAAQAHTGRGERFGRAMMGCTKINGSMAVLQYPLWSTLPPDTNVCDVGSGIGAFAIRLADAYPHLKITLSDLPEVMEEAKVHWKNESAEAVEQERVSFVDIDFLREVPKGADIYYLRHIIHDWADLEAKKILSAVRNAMHTESKLLIHDFIIPEEDGLGQDYGPAATRIYNFDMMMLCMLNGCERTRLRHADFCREVGLKLVNTFNMVEMSILEFQISND